MAERYGCFIWCSAVTIKGVERGTPLGLFQVIGLGGAFANCLSSGAEEREEREERGMGWDGGRECKEADAGEEAMWEWDREGMVSIPALVWNRDSLLATQLETCVRTVISPPYGAMGNTWVVPFRVLTVTHRLSLLKERS